jgi:molecular chaperone HtpG
MDPEICSKLAVVLRYVVLRHSRSGVIGAEMVQHKFQVHLRGIIDLLSEHLYSGPEVYIRELLQNAIDAITARQKYESDVRGEVVIECHGQGTGRLPTLSIRDNGIGLTAEEVHHFLATIGRSSKTADHWSQPADFLGQFGIGILSCFVVSEEIVVLTRSARDTSAAPVEWRARADGTYTVRELERDLPAGTQVWLTARPDKERWFTAEEVRRLVKHYGSLLPVPLHFQAGRVQEVLNSEPPPWRQRYATPAQLHRALLAYGRETFGISFLDAVLLSSEAEGLEGVAYILPFTPPQSARHKGHRIYLKNMFLSETADNLLPEWAFFVRVILNTTTLRPTASRESFVENDQLVTVRTFIGNCLRRYLVHLAEQQPEKLGQFVQLHHRALKALAAEDDEFCAIILDHLPFETSLGTMTFGEYRQNYSIVRYVPDVDTFRQLASVAAAQNLCLLNAGYVYDLDLLTRIPDLFPDLRLEEINSDTLTQEFDELSVEERADCESFLVQADKVLRPFRCRVEVKKFRPEDLPALYSISREGRFQRQVEHTRALSSTLWSNVLEGLAQRDIVQAGTLCFNYGNPLVRRLLSLSSSKRRQRFIEILYVQALLLGHHPLNAREWQLLNQGLLHLLDDLLTA